MDKRGQQPPGAPSKHLRAVSLALSPDDRRLFVSHERTITQIDTESMTVRASSTVELPCRLIHIKKDTHWIVYAIGATYTDNGSNVEEYKPHLYRVVFVKDE